MYEYETATGKARGDFKIYQGRNGAIYLLMGNRQTALTLQQIEDLSLDVYQLINYSHNDYLSYYHQIGSTNAPEMYVDDIGADGKVIGWLEMGSGKYEKAKGE